MNEIQRQWDFVLNHPEEDIRRIAERASKEPALRRLFPYVSMRNLRFSRATTYPYDPLPYILTVEPGDRYEARAPDNAPLFTGSLEEVVEELARRLG